MRVAAGWQPGRRRRSGQDGPKPRYSPCSVSEPRPRTGESIALGGRVGDSPGDKMASPPGSRGGQGSGRPAGLGGADLSGCIAPACRRWRWCRCQCDPPSGGRAAGCAGPVAGTAARRPPAAPPRQACRPRNTPRGSLRAGSWSGCPAVLLPSAASPPYLPTNRLSRQAAEKGRAKRPKPQPPPRPLPGRPRPSPASRQ